VLREVPLHKASYISGKIEMHCCCEPHIFVILSLNSEGMMDYLTIANTLKYFIAAVELKKERCQVVVKSGIGITNLFYSFTGAQINII
jgi:hypothetical protein